MADTADLKSADESLAGSSPASGTLAIWTAWAAGLFEGEGSIFVATINGRSGNYSYARLELKMTDEDVVRQFQRVVMAGKVRYKPPRKAHYKEAWCWQLTNKEECKRVLADFWPYLGTRRKAKALEVGLV